LVVRGADCRGQTNGAGGDVVAGVESIISLDIRSAISGEGGEY
jgi:hypothetical protein